MKTPYDTALRALQREVDALRSSIGSANERLSEIGTARDAVGAAMVRERALVASDWTLPSGAYFARAKSERERLAREERAEEARLDALRAEAMESYGSLRAIEVAAETFRDEAERSAATAEQSRIDDFAGARFARALRARPRATAMAASGD